MFSVHECMYRYILISMHIANHLYIYRMTIAMNACLYVYMVPHNLALGTAASMYR